MTLYCKSHFDPCQTAARHECHAFQIRIFMRSGGPKALLVAPGLVQVHVEHYMETYARVVRITTVRMLFALVAIMELKIDRMDVVTAFLYGDLDEIRNMEVPEGLRDPKHSNLVCK